MIKIGGLVTLRPFLVNESDDSKYTHVGHGRYKQTGKETDANAPTFIKDEHGNYVVDKPKTDKKATTSTSTKPKVNIFDKSTSASSTDNKSSQSITNIPKPKEVSSTKITDLLPKANKKTFDAKSDIDDISPKERHIISMKIDKLDELAKEARAKGKTAPNYNLCKITIPGTNLYCDNNLGIPRSEMPQFKGKPEANTIAAKMKKDKSGEVDTEPLFRKMLATNGIKTYQTELPSDSLKATQNELIGTKVASMTKALEKDPNNSGITAPIYVSRDGYIIDGHHRWAAITSRAIQTGKPKNMKVIVIDRDAKDIIPMANKFAEKIGVATKKADTSSDTKSTDDLLKLKKKLIKQQDILAGKTASSRAVKQKMDANNQRIKDINTQLKKQGSATTNNNVSVGNPKINKFTSSLIQKTGITPKKLGKEKYEKTMAQIAYSALVDANFDEEARKMVAKLENNPEFEKDPMLSRPKGGVSSPNYNDWRKKSVFGSDYVNPDEKTEKIATTISAKAQWTGKDIIDAITNDLKKNGSNKLANTIQSITENIKSVSLKSIISTISTIDDTKK